MNEEKTIKNLGVKKGRLLFFGGIYSNLQALQELQRWAKENEFAPENSFCTGDILGYCAQPVECITLLQDWGVHAIAGNVELQLRNGEMDCGCDFASGGRCDLFSKNWYDYTQRNMNSQTMAWLHTLPHHIRFSFGEKQFLMVHGSWFHTADFIFQSTDWTEKQKNFDSSGADVIVAGHCGLPFASKRAGKLWLNAGVIGMPANDGTDRVWFLTVEQKAEGAIDFCFRHLQYDNEKASRLMLENGLPATYANTLLTGIWDNCEILPPEETAQQGKQIRTDELV